jgi:hypothetical protein
MNKCTATLPFFLPALASAAPFPLLTDGSRVDAPRACNDRASQSHETGHAQIGRRTLVFAAESDVLQLANPNDVRSRHFISVSN